MKQTFEKRTIGDCTFYQGDCLELLAAGVFGKLGAIVSDPPYGIGFQHSGGHATHGHFAIAGVPLQSSTATIYGDDQPFDPKPWIDIAPLADSRTSSGGRHCIVLWGVDNYKSKLPDGGTLLAWDKHLGRGGDDNYADCEWAWCGRKVKREVFRWLWKGVCAQKTDLDLSPTKGSKPNTFARVHISQKPVELMRWCIEKVRPLAGLPILDPYMGSGSTAIAALSLGHTFIGCEIDPGHFDVACRRIEAYYQKQGVTL